MLHMGFAPNENESKHDVIRTIFNYNTGSHISGTHYGSIVSVLGQKYVLMYVIRFEDR